MADEDKLSELGLAIFLARTLRGWTQTDLADASGLTNSMVSEFERGRRTPSKKSLERLTEAMGVPLESLQALIPALASLRGVVQNGVVRRMSTEESAMARIGPLTEDLVRTTLDVVFRGRLAKRDFTPALSDRAQAPEVWSRLRVHEPDDRILLIEEGVEFQSWALCELLCHESADAVGDDPGRAVELAGLALRVAGKVQGTEPWRSRVKGYAWAHVGNARRASGDLPGAEEAFLQAGLLWRAGAAAHPGMLDEARIRAIDDSVAGP